MAGQLKVNGVTLATEESGTVTLEAPQIKDSSNNVILDQSGTNPVLKNVEVVSNSSMMFRNRIINGDMRIDQRNAGASVTPSSGQYTIDRWQFSLSQSSKLTAQQSSTAPTGFTKSLLITSSSAYSIVPGDYFNLVQQIEGFNVADLSWGTSSAATVTLSFWVRSSLIGTFGGAIQNENNNRSYPFTYTIDSQNTWEQKIITIAGDQTGTWDTDNSIGIKVRIGLGVGSTYSGTAGSWDSSDYEGATGATSVVGTSGATFYITGVQLEKGTVATPFEHRPIGTELALCQRYYYTCSRSGYMLGRGNGTTALTDLRIPTPVPMRASPSISNNSGIWYAIDADSYNNGTGATFSIGNFSANHLIVQVGNLTGLTDNRIGMVSLYSGYSLDAEL